MAREQVDAIIDGLWNTFKEYADAATGLSNEQLDAQVPSFGGRTTTLRTMMYQAIYQPLEHSIHIAKILQVTKAPGANPTEAQAMLGEAARSIGTLTGLLARISDEDLDNSFEDQTPRAVSEHVRNSVENAKNRVGTALEGDGADS